MAKFKKRRPRPIRKMGHDYFPTLAELEIASKTYGMTPEEYCKAVNDSAEYEKQMAEESIEKEEIK